MWSLHDIHVEIDAADHPVMIVVVTTPAGRIDLIGSVRRSGRALVIDDAHVQGLTAGALGRRGLHAIGRKLLAEADVDEILIQGGTRTTGRTKGRAPRVIRFPRPGGASGGG